MGNYVPAVLFDIVPPPGGGLITATRPLYQNAAQNDWTYCRLNRCLEFVNFNASAITATVAIPGRSNVVLTVSGYAFPAGPDRQRMLLPVPAEVGTPVYQARPVDISYASPIPLIATITYSTTTNVKVGCQHFPDVLYPL